MIYSLKKPIKLGEQGELITRLVFRDEIVAGDLRGIRASALQDPDLGDLLKIAGRLCSQTDAVMNRLGIEDFGEVVGMVADFLGGGRQTGSKESPS